MANICITDLQKLDPNDLTLGAPLPDHIRDRGGRVLFRAGTLLDDTQMDAVMKRAVKGLYILTDAPADEPEHAAAPSKSAGEETTVKSRSARKRPSAESNPEEIVEALRQQRSSNKSHPARKHERQAWCVPLRLELNEKGSRPRQIEVTSLDLSAGGFAFLFNGYIHEGTGVLAHFDALPNKPQLGGVVRTCTHLSGKDHRIGVQFVQKPTAPARPTSPAPKRSESTTPSR